MVEEDATQGLNRYSYCLNNPLSRTDPSGSISFRQVLGAAIAIAASVMGFGAATALGSFLWAVGGGFASAFISTGSLKAGFWGAVSAAVFWGIGNQFSNMATDSALASASETYETFMNTGLTGGQFAAQVAAHSAAGGTLNVLQGGKFGHGFVSAGVTKALTPAVDAASSGNIVAGAVGSALIGGTASELSGGKFSNGAATAAFQFLFNEIATELQKNATRVQETIYSEIGGSFRDFTLRLGVRVNALTQENNVEFTAALGARLEIVQGQEVDRFGAVIVTQGAATWSAASLIPKGFVQVHYKGVGLTIHAHPEHGRITRSDKLFRGDDGSSLRIGARAPGIHKISGVDRRAGPLFLATPRGVLFFNGHSTSPFQ